MLEVAYWDALGKGLGVPASTFFGGRVASEIDFMGFPQGDTPEELARHAAELAADQAVHTTAELRAVLEQEAADAVVIGSHESGGLWRLRQMAYLAEAHGIPLNRHGCIERAIATFAGLQVAACIPNLTLGNQLMNHLLAESLVCVPPELAEGRSPVPNGPGLSFELDDQAIARAREHHERQGPYAAVDPADTGELG